MRLYESFLESDRSFFEPDGKVGLLATLDAQGLPHLTLITAMRAPDTRHLVFGQFCEGLGKRHAEQQRRVGFLLMTLQKSLWRGKADWTHKAGSGPERDAFNAKPMWRYNAYFGIHTVHYLDLVGTTRAEKLPMGAILAGVLRAGLRRGAVARSCRGAAQAMNPWTRALISRTGNLKFLAWAGPDGYPWIVPCLSATAAGPAAVYLPGTEYGRELAELPDGSPACLLAMSLGMEDVLVRGTFARAGRGGRASRGGRGGVLRVDWVYNPMPPYAKRIYPPEPANAKVTAFD